MFEYQVDTVNSGQGSKYRIYRHDQQLRFNEFLRLLQARQEFATFFINLLADVKFHAYQWETPPLNAETKEDPFEFVVTRNPAIDLPPDPEPFSKYFNREETDKVAVFKNLGGDATLIAPTPSERNKNYSHIGVFTQQAPISQQKKLWSTVGKITENKISDRSLWLNTAGGGVAWLHVRLDSAPKYYKHKPYTRFA